MGIEKKRVILVAILASAVLVASVAFLRARPPLERAYHGGPKAGKTRLVWFIPDGLRADPDVFQIFRWAEEGKLPNLRRMMELGAWGYSIPVFPSHTPVNYASLLTGTFPGKHGVADGPMHLPGYPLNMISLSGFHSTAKKVDPVWTSLEDAGLSTSLLSVPGSTPPETSRSQVIAGRWGGWGVEFPSMIFNSRSDDWLRKEIGWNDRVFGVEKRLTEFVSATAPSGWAELPQSFSPPLEVALRNWGAEVFLLLVDRTNDGKENYDSAVLSLDKRSVLATLGEGQDSPWFPLRLRYETARQYQKDAPARLAIEEGLSGVYFDLPVRLRVIKLGKKGFFRVRMLYSGLNESLVVPRSLARELERKAGPMVDYVDNYPPQLVYYEEDKAAFLDEAEQSLDWHRKASAALMGDLAKDVLIHSIYTPNQMLTSRWWMGAVDPAARSYPSTPAPARELAWREVLAMYQKIDDMLGDALAAMGPDSWLVFSSDHGAAPLDREVRLNNFFASKGWLSFAYDAKSGRQEVDWARTRVVYLNMNHIFVNPEGLAGPYRPAKGANFDKLRAEVLTALRGLRDEEGRAPLADVITREEAGLWHLPSESVGDLVISNRAGFSWAEEVSPDQAIFVRSFKGGYKQAIPPEQTKALWTPFVIVGPGVKKGHRISRPVSHVEQLPTILHLMKLKSRHDMDAPPLAEILESKD